MGIDHTAAIAAGVSHAPRPASWNAAQKKNGAAETTPRYWTWETSRCDATVVACSSIVSHAAQNAAASSIHVSIRAPGTSRWRHAMAAAYAPTAAAPV